MNKRAKLATSILIILVVIILTSAVMLLLVKTGVLSVKESSESVLNTEFIPYQRDGKIAIKDFHFCGKITENSTCVGEGPEFDVQADVYFRFVVESTVYDGEVKLVENYRIKDAKGKVILEADSTDNFYFELISGAKFEKILFTDYFSMSSDDPAGEYILELIVSNALLNKKSKLVKKFELFELPEDEGGVEP
jgi:hypothetical protein